MSKLSASPPLCFGAIIKWNELLEHGQLGPVTVVLIMEVTARWLMDVDAPDREGSHPGWEGMRFHYATQDHAQLKTYELFISGSFHLIFSHCGWLWVTKTSENKTKDKGGATVFWVEVLFQVVRCVMLIVREKGNLSRWGPRAWFSIHRLWTRLLWSLNMLLECRPYCWGWGRLSASAIGIIVLVLKSPMNFLNIIFFWVA